MFLSIENNEKGIEDIYNEYNSKEIDKANALKQNFFFLKTDSLKQFLLSLEVVTSL